MGVRPVCGYRLYAPTSIAPDSNRNGYLSGRVSESSHSAVMCDSTLWRDVPTAISALWAIPTMELRKTGKMQFKGGLGT
jgi:hypothetical protein